MNADEMLALAERCEKATGPDIDLDLAISDATKAWVSAPTWKQFRPTASIDAAMSLVPEGWAKYVADDEYGCHACVWDRGSPEKRGKSGGCKDAATPALALCAAALRARTLAHPGDGR